MNDDQLNEYNAKLARLARIKRLDRMNMELVRIELIEKALNNVGIEGLNFN